MDRDASAAEVVQRGPVSCTFQPDLQIMSAVTGDLTSSRS